MKLTFFILQWMVIVAFDRAIAVPIGARIQAGSSGVKVRAAAGSATILGTNNAGTYGTVLSGPTDAKISGSSDTTIYHWYQVDWDSPATDGWTADVGFTQPTPNGPAPTSPGYESAPGQVVGSQTVQINWSAASSSDSKVTTGYELDVYDLDATQNQLSTYTTTGTSKSVTLIYGHRYFWLVYAKNSNLSRASESLYFWLVPRPAGQSPGYNTSPGQNLTTVTPSMTWGSIASAQAYKIYVLQYPYGSGNVVYSTRVSSPALSALIPANTLSENTAYQWKVTAFFNDALKTDVESDASDPLFFQTPLVYNLNIQVFGNGSYTVSPPGGRYAAGTVLTLSAVPGSGSEFSEWQGATYGRDSTFNFTKGGADENIELHFRPLLLGGNLNLSVAGSTPATLGVTSPTPANWLTLFEGSQDLQLWAILSANMGQSPTASVSIRPGQNQFFIRTLYCPVVTTPPFLDFPIQGSTPKDAPVLAIFDHSRPSYEVSKLYDKNHNIRTCEGITYFVPSNDRGRDSQGNLLDYAPLPAGTTVSSLFTYVGVGSQGGAGNLNYDGHPGYDYGFGKDTDVYAAAAGTTMTDDDFVGTNLEGAAMATYYMSKLHAVIVRHTQGYATIYMHLSDVDAAYVDKSDPSAWKPVKANVSTSAHIGKSGKFDAISPVGYHFHFEVWRLDAGTQWNYADPYGLSVVNPDATKVIAFPYLWNFH
jgi:hypothetical protein